LVFGTAVDINNKAKIGTDLIIGSGTAQIAGQVDGNVKGGVGEATVSSTVGGNVNLQVEKLTIAPQPASRATLSIPLKTKR